MNKTRTKCIQGDATRAANTGVIFEELKIFYDAMTPRHDLRAGSPNSEREELNPAGDTFLVRAISSWFYPFLRPSGCAFRARHQTILLSPYALLTRRPFSVYIDVLLQPPRFSTAEPGCIGLSKHRRYIINSLLSKFFSKVSLRGKKCIFIHLL